MRIMFVHGRSQQGKDPELLKQQWLSTLEEGFRNIGISLPSDLSIQMPYYGDELEALRQEHRGIRERGSDGAPSDVDFARFQLEIVAELGELAGVEIELKDRKAERGPANWEWVQSILKILDTRFPGIGDGTLSRFTEDVYLYLTVPEIRSRVDSIVKALIADDDIVVVSHSLGTVVAYNVIVDQIRAEKTIPGFITLGSPLGLKVVYSKLAQPLIFPRSVATWYNAYDEADVVALNPLDNAHFPVDHEIENNNSVKNRTKNRHGITGYLNDSNVAREIAARAGLV